MRACARATRMCVPTGVRAYAACVSARVRCESMLRRATPRDIGPKLCSNVEHGLTCYACQCRRENKQQKVTPPPRATPISRWNGFKQGLR